MDTFPDQFIFDSERSNGYTRIQAVLALQPVISRRKFMHVLGHEWCRCDNIGRYKDELMAIFKDSKRHWQEMMVTDELAMLMELPLRIKIYRGAPINFIPGLSWTLNVDVAESYRDNDVLKSDKSGYGQFTVATAEVNKQDVVAIKGTRSESTIIVCDPSRLNDLSFDWL
jgi:hypothetical protein